MRCAYTIWKYDELNSFGSVMVTQTNTNLYEAKREEIGGEREYCIPEFSVTQLKLVIELAIGMY